MATHLSTVKPIARGRKSWVGVAVAVGLATILFAGVAMASGDGLTGTWYQRDSDSSNIFYFIDEPIGGVYPVVFYDDFTGLGVCGDNGPMLWSGFLTETETNLFEGTFGTYWCPDNGDGVFEDLLGLGTFGVSLMYDPDRDTISGGLGVCVGTRQQGLDDPNEAAEEIAEGRYPPPPDPEGSC